MNAPGQTRGFSQRERVGPGGAKSDGRFPSLLKFYLACIEEEDLRSLTLKLTQHHRSFVSPWDDVEPLFYPEAPEVRFEVRYESDRKLLTRGVAQAGEVERFSYGYHPVLLDEGDFLTSLPVMGVGVNANIVVDYSWGFR